MVYRVLQGNIRGSGIGLSIVKEVARMHGSRVRVKSELGLGSTFEVIIPASKVAISPENKRNH